MAILHAALCIFQTLLGLGSRTDEPRDATDWLKLSLAVAAQPEDEESKRVIHVALETNNQVFLDFLRAALNTRIAAAARLADIEKDAIECRAFLPGSPALWGWTTNMAAESTLLQSGIEAAIDSSVFDSSSASCSKTSEDVFIGLNLTENMGGATLRDIYAKAWEFHREPLIWTPRGPGAGVGRSTWTLTPASLLNGKTRNRRVSDASESRSSIAGQSPCLYAQRSRTRRDSLHDVFTTVDAKQKSKATPCADAGMFTPSPSLITPPLPSAGSEHPMFRGPRRSTSCTRSHISSTTAVTVSECSTTQDLHGFGLGLSFDRSAWSRPATPSETCFGDRELGKEVSFNGKRTAPSRLLGGRGPPPSGASHRSKTSNHPTFTDNSKQSKPLRPSVTPLQRIQAAMPKRTSGPQRLARTASATKAHGDSSIHSSRLSKVVTSAQSKLSAHPQGRSTLRRAQSVTAMPLSPSPQVPRGTIPKTPLIGPVPATRRVSLRHDITGSSRTTQHPSREAVQDKQAALPYREFPQTPQSNPRQASSAFRTPSISQSRIPRPASRADSVISIRAPSVPATRTPRREPQQLLTPTSTLRVRERASFSQAPRPALTDRADRSRSRTRSSVQDCPILPKDSRLSRPSWSAPLKAGSVNLTQHRSRRSDSVTSAPAIVDQWDTTVESCDVQIAA